MGKSSLVNMIAGRDRPLARTSDSAVGTTFSSDPYHVDWPGGPPITLWDTAGLNESETGKVDPKKAISNIYELTRTLNGVDLLVFCLRGKITNNAVRNYNMFNSFCDGKVPIVLVVTGMEHRSPTDTQIWWKENSKAFDRAGIHVVDHACVATLKLPGREADYKTWTEMVRGMIERRCLPTPWTMESDNWFVMVVTKLLEALFDGPSERSKKLYKGLMMHGISRVDARRVVKEYEASLKMALESLYPEYQPISLASPLSLAELEANVSRIDAEIAQLQVERRQVYKNWRKSKASIAPITHLPIETIRQIFLECGGTATISKHYGKPLSPPMCLLRVCRSWHRIADSIEGLWTKIEVDGGSEEAQWMLRACLRRSGRLPLDITLDASIKYGEKKEVEVKAMALMLQHLHRWRNITIRWRGEDFNPKLIPEPVDPAVAPDMGHGTPVNEVAYHAPMLETLRLETNAIDDASQDLQTAKDLAVITANAPKLRVFTWETQKSYELDECLDLRLPWAQLVDLNLTCFMSVKQCVDILQECKRVEMCDFYLVRVESMPNLHVAVPTSLHNLQSLLINSLLPLESFFNSFTFPALHALHISNSPTEYEDDREFDMPEWSQASFLDLLQRSNAPLARLTFNVTMSENDLIECLTCVGGTLHSLAINSPDRVPFVSTATARILSHHVAGESVTCMCPKLDWVHLGSHVVMALAEDALVYLAESRWNDQGHLSHRQVCSPKLTELYWEVEQGVVPPGDIRKLAKLKKAGMPIRSSYHQDIFAS
ncbi:hypothetical protein HWV62_25788 [Athelia sp. TMB]|nr:hypothetical protein HWV62_25788 [Athelia sp. TMB]